MVYATSENHIIGAKNMTKEKLMKDEKELEKNGAERAVFIPVYIHRTLKIIAANEERTLSNLMTELSREYIKHGPKKAK